ncbi:MAG: ankyrin repeat domain-containing protein [Armatimonadetes bacterium]|nr:ankyrin repeat domain-containing protein [Armatimonadota bacterium]
MTKCRLTFFSVAIAALLVVCSCGSRVEPTNIWEAADFGDVDALREYLDSGVDVNATNPDGRGTPIKGAAKFGHMACVELLIARGADVTQRSGPGVSPLEDAIIFRQLDVVKILVENGAMPTDAVELQDVKNLANHVSSPEIKKYINSLLD